MFEHRTEPLLPRRLFWIRLAASAGIASVVILGSLVAGMIGYRGLEHLSWIDAFLNASMLLGGMGPLDRPNTFAGKLFAGTYALYCGLVVIVVAGIMLAPVAHRFLHRFHLEEGESGDS